jgi:hypothetical protein
MDHNGYLVYEQPDAVCSFFIINLINILYFKKMIPGSKGALLSLAPLKSLIANERWVSIRERSL